MKKKRDSKGRFIKADVDVDVPEKGLTMQERREKKRPV